MNPFRKLLEPKTAFWVLVISITVAFILTVLEYSFRL